MRTQGLREKLVEKWKIAAGAGVVLVLLTTAAFFVARGGSTPAVVALDVTPVDDGAQIETGPMPPTNTALDIVGRNEPVRSVSVDVCDNAIPGVDIGDDGFSAARVGEGVPLAGTGAVGAAKWRWEPGGQVGFLGGGGELAAVQVAPENETQYIGAVKFSDLGMRWARALPHKDARAILAGNVLWASAVTDTLVHLAALDVATGKMLGCVAVPGESWSATNGGGFFSLVPVPTGELAVAASYTNVLLEPNGSLRWTSELDSWTPRIAGNGVIVGESSVYNRDSGESTYSLVALSLQDGKEQWSVPVETLVSDAQRLPSEPEAPVGPFTIGTAKLNAIRVIGQTAIVTIGGLRQNDEFLTETIVTALNLQDGTSTWRFVTAEAFLADASDTHVFIPPPYSSDDPAPVWVDISTGTTGRLPKDMGRAFAITGRSLVAATTKGAVAGGLENGEGVRLLDGVEVIGKVAGQTSHETSPFGIESKVAATYISGEMLLASVRPQGGSKTFVYAWEVNP